jgi:hypothetical protein
VGQTGPPFELVWWVFSRDKAAGAWSWHPSSAEVRNEWSYTSPPLYTFMCWTGKTSSFYMLSRHWMNDVENSAVKIRILNSEFVSPVKIVTCNYRSGKRDQKLKCINLLYT